LRPSRLRTPGVSCCALSGLGSSSAPFDFRSLE